MNAEQFIKAKDSVEGEGWSELGESLSKAMEEYAALKIAELATADNSAIDAIALLSRCADHICGDVKLTPTAQVELLHDIEQYEQRHQ